MNQFISTCAWDDEAKFWLSPIVNIAYNRGLNGRDLNRAQRMVEEHRDTLEKGMA